MTVLFWVGMGLLCFFGFMAFTGAPYVPSKRREIREAFTTLYSLSDKDVLVDIGAGDGIVLREASRVGAKAIGFEINPALVVLAKWLSRKEKNVSVRLANFWHTPLPDDTTVVYVFGDGRDIGNIYRRVQAEASRLERHLMLVSYGFDIKGVSAAGRYRAYFLYKV